MPHHKQYLPKSSTETLTCQEYQCLRRQSFAHSADFDYLLSQSLPCFDVRFVAGEPVLIARQYLASIWLPSGQRLEILPKITPQHSNDTMHPKDKTPHLMAVNDSRQWVANMLSQIAGRVSPRPMNAISHHGQRLSQQTWFEADKPWYTQLYQHFTDLILQVMDALPQQYQQRTQNTPQAQGKINFKQQLKHNLHRPHYFVTAKDHWQSHHLLWQFLLTAWQQAQFVLDAQASTRSQNQVLSAFIAQLNDGSLAGNAQSNPTLLANKLPKTQWHSAYQQLQQDKVAWLNQCTVTQRHLLIETIQWAWWFLQPTDTQALPFAGEKNIPCQAFMLNMSHAFEQWVTQCIAEQIATDDTLKDLELLSQPSFDWLVTQDRADTITRQLRPDVCLQRHSTLSLSTNMGSTNMSPITHVIDIKYKPLSGVASIDSSDLYQLQAYQYHLQAQQAWLIYPANEQFTQPIVLKNIQAMSNKANATVNNHDNSMTLVPFCVFTGRLLIDFV